MTRKSPTPTTWAMTTKVNSSGLLAKESKVELRLNIVYGAPLKTMAIS
jgi:hypothetical protein